MVSEIDTNLLRNVRDILGINVFIAVVVLFQFGFVSNLFNFVCDIT